MELEPPTRIELPYTAGIQPDQAKDEVRPVTASPTYDLFLDYSSSINLIRETRELNNAAIDRNTGWTREMSQDTQVVLVP